MDYLEGTGIEFPGAPPLDPGIGRGPSNDYYFTQSIVWAIPLVLVQISIESPVFHENMCIPVEY